MRIQRGRGIVTRKQALYSLTKIGWFLIVIGTAVLVFTGQTEPVIAPSQLPTEPMVIFGGAAGAGIAGVLVVMHFQHRSWKAMGRKAGLTPDGGSVLPIGKPDLTGTINGRPVRVRIKTRKSGTSTEGGTNTTSYMVVETDLDQPADEGAIITRNEGQADTERIDFGSTSVMSEPVDGGFVTSAGSADLVRSVLSEPVEDTLREVHTVDRLLVGDAVSTLTDAVPDMGDSLLGSVAESAMEMSLSGDPSTVTHEMDDIFVDSGLLLRQVRAVVAVADAFEDATADDKQE